MCVCVCARSCACACACACVCTRARARSQLHATTIGQLASSSQTRLQPQTQPTDMTTTSQPINHTQQPSDRTHPVNQPSNQPAANNKLTTTSLPASQPIFHGCSIRTLVETTFECRNVCADMYGGEANCYIKRFPLLLHICVKCWKSEKTWTTHVCENCACLLARSVRACASSL